MINTCRRWCVVWVTNLSKVIKIFWQIYLFLLKFYWIFNFYLSPGLGQNFFCTLLACRFLGLTDNLCFCAELSSKGDLLVSPTTASRSGSALCFLEIWNILDGVMLLFMCCLVNVSHIHTHETHKLKKKKN